MALWTAQGKHLLSFQSLSKPQTRCGACIREIKKNMENTVFLSNVAFNPFASVTKQNLRNLKAQKELT